MDLNNSTTPESEKDSAATPTWFVKAVEEHFNVHFILDVCANAATAKCADYFSLQEYGIDSLTRSWGVNGDVVWCNPPYSNIKPFIAKAEEQALLGCTTFMLIPDKPDTKVTRAARSIADTIVHMPFRLQFVRPDGSFFLDSTGKKSSPKFPVMLVIISPHALGMPCRDIYVDLREYNGGRQV